MEELGVEHLSFTLEDGRSILQDLTFSLAAGSFGVIVGPSGAGKTTTLNLIAGFQRPTAGTVTLGNAILNDVPPEHRDIAMVFENYVLYPHKTVRQNLEFPLRSPNRQQDLSRAEVAERIEQVVRTLRIKDLVDRLPSQLSGGQRQRVSLGRALVRRPRLLLLDEPISHLDAKLRHEMRTELRRIQRDLGVTTLYATPDQADALALADWAVVLDAGKVLQIGSARQLYDAPTHVRVAQMLGDPKISVLPGVLDPSGLTVLGRRYDIEPAARSMSESRPVLVGARPSSVQFRPAEDRSTQGTVVLHQYLGYGTALHADVAGLTVRSLVPGRSQVQVDDKVSMSLNTQELLLFDPDSGSLILG